MDSSIWGCILLADRLTAHLIGEVQLIGKSRIIGLRQTSQQKTSMFQRFWRVSLIHVKSIQTTQKGKHLEGSFWSKQE